MLHTLPPASVKSAPREPEKTACRPAAPTRGLVYTLYRHGRGLSHEAAGGLLRAALRSTPEGPDQAA